MLSDLDRKSDPARLLGQGPSAGAGFVELRDRKRQLERLAEGHLQALQRFHYGADLTGLERGGVSLSPFALEAVPEHTDDPRMSISSTTTCVRSLLASPAVGDRARFALILEALGQRWTEQSLKTGELAHNNPYTLGQLLPVLRRMSADAPALLPDAIAALRGAVGNPGVSLGGFPPNGFLTWWALVALESWGERDPQQCALSLDWS